MEIDGAKFESEFTSILNRNKQDVLWNILGFDPTHAYLVNVSYNQPSKITNGKVKPKSDCYVARINEDISQLLQDNNFVLTEKILLNHKISFEPIAGSGISIKLPNSEHYTLQKISYSAFCNMFTGISSSNFIAALLFVDFAQINKNSAILANFNQTISSLCADLQVEESATELATYKLLKHKAVSTISNYIKNHKEAYNALCFGDGIFEEPYSASFIYEQGRLLPKDNYHAKISVTTGSGRSKGIYTLAFK